MPTVARFQFRKDTTANWQLANPILLDGEMGIEQTENGSLMFKIGDGIANAAGVVSGTHWNDLPYVSGPEGKPPVHEWNGTTLRFQNPDGSWGNSVNLIGPKGTKGDTGNVGPQGPAGPPYVLPPATITKLGGIKVGKNLSITIDGCLSAPDPFYVPMLGIIAYRGGIGGSDGRRPVYWDNTVNEDWVLCDGITTNGIPVPDLRDKFIVGAGRLYDILSSGGALSHKHGMFFTNQYHAMGGLQSTNYDTRDTGYTYMTASDMPDHTHNIFMGNGWQQHGWTHVYGQGAAWCDPRYFNTGNWNNSADVDRLITGATPDPDKRQPNPQTGRKYAFDHMHHLRRQYTEMTNSLPPYYALIYLMRIH